MKLHVRLVVVATALASLLQVVPTWAAGLGPETSKRYTLLIPSAAMTVEGVSFAGRLKVAANITPADNGPSVNGRPDWRDEGFPAMWTLYAEKVKRKDKKGQMTVKLVSQIAAVTLEFDGFRDGGALDSAFGVLALAGPSDSASAEEYLADAYTRLGDAIFGGSLASIDSDGRNALLRYAHLQAKASALSAATFRDNTYLAVDLGRHTVVYNSLQLNQSQRVARVLSERLLDLLKLFAEPVKSAPDIYGLKLTLKIPFKSFLDEYARPDLDELEIHTASADISEFAEAGITSQELVDRSAVILNGNRIAVPLAE